MMVVRRRISELIDEGAILEIQDGNHGEKHPTSKDYVEEGIPFLMARDFKESYVDLQNACKISKKLADSLRIGFARSGDVLLTHKGTIGSVAIVPKVPDYVMLTPQVTYYRTNPKQLLNSYLRYAFQAPHFRNQLDSFSAQSTRPYIGITAQRQLEIDYPPLPVQRRIASILSAYDELIENNQRRIKILEEMARSLYREWFVHFRFPGHEKVKMAPSSQGSIPQGWEMKKLVGITTFLSRGISPRYDDWGNSIVINQKCIRDRRLSLDLARRQRKPIPPDKLVRFGDVLINSTGVGTLGRVAQVYEDMEQCTVDSHVSIVRPDSDTDIDYFGCALLLKQEAFERLGVGATGQTELGRTSIGEVEIPIPPVALQKQFGALIRPMRMTVIMLTKQCENLRRTRDLLLPRLLSGKIPLSC